MSILVHDTVDIQTHYMRKNQHRTTEQIGYNDVITWIS